VTRVLGVEPGRPIDPEKGLFEMGMDSLMSVELKTRLERLAGRPLPSTLTFNYPNVSSLARFIGEVVLQPRTPEPSAGDRDRAVGGRDRLLEGCVHDESEDASEDELAEMLAARLEALR
jgi:acyl carrier protein